MKTHLFLACMCVLRYMWICMFVRVHTLGYMWVGREVHMLLQGKGQPWVFFYFRELSPFETSSLLAETVIRKPRPAGLGASRDLPVSISPLPSLKSQKMNHHAQLFFLTWILRTDLGLLSHKGKCFTLTHLPSLR